MRAASRESLGQLRADWPTLTTGVGQNWAELAEELRQVVGLFAAEPGLRRALADPASSADDRAGLAGGLLTNRITPVAGRVVEAAVRSRWSTAGDLLNAIELLSVTAELEVAEASGSDGLVNIEDQLFRFSQTVAAHAELSRVLGDNTAPVTDRARLVSDLLADKADAVTVRLVTLALRGIGGRSFAGGLAHLVELVAARREAQVAYVRSAAPLTTEQESRLAARLAEVYGRKVSLQVRVDPSVIGGAIVEIGDDRYDGSVASRLEQARAALDDRG